MSADAGLTAGLTRSSAETRQAHADVDRAAGGGQWRTNGSKLRPAAGYVGADTLTLVTNDLGHTGTGGARTATSTVAISVHPVNDVTAANDSYSTNENAALTVDAAHGVPATHTDAEHGLLGATSASDAEPRPGLSPARRLIRSYAGCIFRGRTPVFTYSATDGDTTQTATVLITVNYANDFHRCQSTAYLSTRNAR